MLPFVGGIACDPSSRQEFVRLFEDRSKKFTGGQHNYDQVLENIRLCEAQKSARGSRHRGLLREGIAEGGTTNSVPLCSRC